MHLTTLLALTASLLASQVTGQNISPMLDPAAYLAEVDSDSFADGNTNSDPMVAYMASSVTPSKTPSSSTYMATPMSTHSAMYQHMPFHPSRSPSMGSMMTKVKSSSMSKSMPYMKPMATPSPNHSLQIHAQPKQIEQGGIAPVDAMQPGSQVAPVLMEKPHGKDIGNSFCMGSCFANQSEAQCAKPYESAIYQSGQDCWMCCFTSPDF